MSEGGTHVGSIQGDLKLDISQWVRKIDEARAKARELDGTGTNIRVEADTAGANAALTRTRETVDAVTAAEARHAAALEAETATFARARIAQERLNEARANGRSKESSLMAATEAARVATERAKRASEQADAAERGLAAARAAGAAAADAEAVATDKVARAQKAGEKQAFDWRSSAIGGLVAVSAAAPPVAAALVGVTGALGVMGAAGMLGIAGVVRGMKDGTATGHAWRGVVSALADDVHRLQDSSAASMLPGVEKSVSVLDAKMPQLTALTGKYARILGDILPTGLDATVTLLDRADPILERGARYLGHLVQGLDGFAHGQGYQDFLDYTVRNGPEVERFLGHAGHLLVDFLAAWAPVGETTLPVLDHLVTGFDDLVKRTGPLVPTAIAVAGAYKLLSPTTGLLGTLISLTRTLGFESAATAGKIEAEAVAGSRLGRVGNVAKGVGALGLMAATLPGTPGGDALGTSLMSLLPHDVRTEVLSHDIRADPQKSGASGLIGKNQTETFAASDQGLADLRASDPKKAAAQFRYIGEAAAAEGVSVSELAALYPKYTAAVNGAHHATIGQTAAVSQEVSEYHRLAAAQADVATKAQGVEQTRDAARDSIDQLSASIKQNGSSLDKNTAKGRANRESMLAGVQAAQAYGAAVQQKTGSEAQGRVATDRMAVSMVNAAVKMGIGRKAAEDLTRKLLGIPKGVSVTAQLKADEFQVKLDRVRAQMKAINGLTSDVYINAIATGVDPSRAAQINRNAQMNRATGGTAGGPAALPGLAYGGSPGFTVRGPGHASSDAAGTYRLANGEEVTSNLTGQADRFRPVLKAINAGRVRDMSDLAGALGGRSGTVVQKTVNVGGVHLHNPVAVDPVQAAEDASQHIAAYANFPL